MSERTTYVHDGTEVVLTGRTAVRKIQTPGSSVPKEFKKVEITPLEFVDAGGGWKKWVDPSELFEIQ
jgi:hypothetical protein